MPPKKQSKTHVDTPTTSSAKTLQPVAAPTTVTTMNTTLYSAATLKRPVLPVTTQPIANYESPLKKLKKSMSQQQHTVIDRIYELRDFIKTNKVRLPEVRSSIRIQGRLLWSFFETVRDMHFLRLYLGEQQAPEPLEQQQQEFKAAQKENPYQANQYLITVSLFEVAQDDPSLPAPGDIISFSPTKLSLFHDCIQVNTKLQSIMTVAP